MWNVKDNKSSLISDRIISFHSSNYTSSNIPIGIIRMIRIGNNWTSRPLMILELTVFAFFCLKSMFEYFNSFIISPIFIISFDKHLHF